MPKSTNDDMELYEDIDQKEPLLEQEQGEVIDTPKIAGEILESSLLAQIDNKHLVLEFYEANNLILSPRQKMRFLEMPSERTITSCRTKKHKVTSSSKKSIKFNLTLSERLLRRLWR